MSRAIADFAKRGGGIRVIASPELSQQDIDALERGYELRDVVTESVLRVITATLDDPATRPHAEFLATLVANRTLELRLAVRPGAFGIFHDKVGVLRDGDDHVLTFTGSLNESLAAWDPRGNHESFEVFSSWGSRDAAARVREHESYFESLWAGVEPGLTVVDFPDAARAKLLTVANPEGIEAAWQRIEEQAPHPAEVLTPMPHQIAALASWERNGRRGILSHATASGKTLTAIEAMRVWLIEGNPVLVVVPGQILLEQWRAEIQRQLGPLAEALLVCGAGHAEWMRDGVLASMTAPDMGPRVILSTIQTASTPDFGQRLRPGAHLMLVCDEVHRAGAQDFARVLDIEAGGRLGISASYERFGDVSGTARIRDYFGVELDPKFGIADGIRVGRLVPYTYHVHFVELDDDEAAEWKRLSHEISRAAALAHGARREVLDDDRVKTLLIRRARILKQARRKVPVAVDLLLASFNSGQRWLVYCDDQRQLSALLYALRAAGLPATEYHSAMEGDRSATLGHFKLAGGILLAIRCLDEGVDIPSADHALILASSRNPREFIQRRGRLLRKTDDKWQAEIHDILVEPPPTGEPEYLAILAGEMVRALEFAESAANDGVKFRLRTLIRALGLPVAQAKAGFELDSEAEGDGQAA